MRGRRKEDNRELSWEKHRKQPKESSRASFLLVLGENEHRMERRRKFIEKG